MRRNYMSPEYTRLKVWGSFNMVEESNFFSSKMMDIEDVIMIKNQDIIYYQNPAGEQIDISVESSLTSNVYSSINSKRDGHTLSLDGSQNSTQKESNTRWILEILPKKILSDYIFASIKKFRSFEGMTSNMTIYEGVNVAIQRYIEFNIIEKYRLSEIELFIQYRNLRSQNILRFKNNWNPEVENATNKYTKLQTETSIDGESLKVIFNQEQDSKQFAFDYYYNLYFQKI